MNKTLCLLAAGFLILASGCNNPRFTKLKGGLEYKIISGNGGTQIKYGNSIQFRVQQYYNDSLLSTPYDTISQVIEIDSTKVPAIYVNIFKAAKKGDSIVTRISTDTIMKSNQLPPFAKKGNYFGYRFKIINVITDPTEALALKDISMQNFKKVDSISMEKQTVIDDSTINAYLTKNNIKAIKSPQGTYVEVQNPGDGEQVDTGKAVSVNYKGMTFDGKIFDQSYDSTGKPIKPFTFLVGQRGAIAGWSDGMVYFKKGGKGRLFLPSGRAYGSRGAGANIKPNTPLIFEVSIEDVMTKEQYQQQMIAKQKMQQMMQQQMQQKMQEQQKQQQQQQTPQPGK